MQTEIDPAYLAQTQTARENVYNSGKALAEQRKALFAGKADQLLQALKFYNEAVEAHNVILDAVQEETCGGDYWEKPEKWRKSEIGQAYEEWMQGFELAKIEPLEERDVRAEHVHIIQSEGDANDIPDRLHIIRWALEGHQ